MQKSTVKIPYAGDEPTSDRIGGRPGASADQGKDQWHTTRKAG
jgi:hypothetical protein